MDNLIQTVKNNDLVKILLILGAVYLFMQYYHKENLENVEKIPVPTKVAEPLQDMPFAQNASATTTEAKQIDKIIAGPTTLTTKDLLPKYDDANEFAKQNPTSKLLQEQNFLTSGYHMGINSISQSHKIKYNDLRSCPPIPKQEVGPFNNSSYEMPAGAGRRYLEIN